MIEDVTMPPSLTIYYTDRFKDHDTGPHVEQPKRMDAIASALKAQFVNGEAGWAEPRAATEEELRLVHTQAHIHYINETAKSGGGMADPDTVISPESFDVAKRAAGAMLDAVDTVVNNPQQKAFALCRPPGHHCLSDRAMGFCLFNNIAIAARYAQTKHQLNKILILDWDVHHGNGTQDIFYEDDSVFFISTHQYPHYPGTGGRSEKGKGKGEGFTENLPFPAYTQPHLITDTVAETLERVLPEFKPDLLLISAGFDGHKDDPLGNWMLEEQHFAAMTGMMMKHAEMYCGGRLAACLEGGYNLQSLAASCAAHCGELAGI